MTILLSVVFTLALGVSTGAIFKMGGHIRNGKGTRNFNVEVWGSAILWGLFYLLTNI